MQFSEHISFTNPLEAIRRQLNTPMTIPDFAFSDSDFFCDFNSDSKFLDEYTEDDFMKILTDYGFLDDLKNMGYSQPILRMECKDKFVHRLSLLDRSLMSSPDQQITEKNFLMDMFMRKKDLITYQLKAYQDLKYRANHLNDSDIDDLDSLIDIPDKGKFKPEYFRDSPGASKKMFDSHNIKLAKTLSPNTFSLDHENNLGKSSIEDSSSIDERSKSSAEDVSSVEESVSDTDDSTIISKNGNDKAETETSEESGSEIIPIEKVGKSKHQSGSVVTASSIINSIFSFLNNKMNEEASNLMKAHPPSSPSPINKSPAPTLNSINTTTTSNTIINESLIPPSSSLLPPPSITLTNTTTNETISPYNKPIVNADTKEKTTNQMTSITSTSENDHQANTLNEFNEITTTTTSAMTTKENNQNTMDIDTTTSSTTTTTTTTNNNNNNNNTKINTNMDVDTTQSNDSHTLEETHRKSLPVDNEAKNTDKNSHASNSISQDISMSNNDPSSNSETNPESTNERYINNLHTLNSHDENQTESSSEDIRKRKLTPLVISKRGATKVIKFLEKNINTTPEMKITEIEWVCMQNPRGKFSLLRPQCPGQRFPGLKMGRKISNLMISLAKLKGRDGLADTPEHFHNATIYSQKGYMFINPAFHGYFVSLLYDLNKDLREHGLAAVSWAFKLGHVINKKTGKSEFWHPEEQIYPTSDRLHKYFMSDQYLNLVEHYRKVHLGRVYIDWNEAKECLIYSIKDLSKKKKDIPLKDEINKDDNKDTVMSL